MSDYQETQELLRKMHAIAKGKSRRKSRVTDAKILRTRTWVESILRDNHICRLELESLFFGCDRESTGTVLRWLKGKQTINESTVRSFSKIPEIQSDNLDLFKLPIFELLDQNLKKSVLYSLIQQYQNQTKLGDIWSFPESERFPLDKDAGYLLCSSDDSEALFQIGGVYGFVGILMLVRHAEIKRDWIKHWLYLQDAYRAFPSFCRNKYFKKRWKEFFILLRDIHFRVYSSVLTISPNIEVIEKQIFAKRHPTMRHKWPRSPIDNRFAEPERPYALASLPSYQHTSKTSLFRLEKPLI